MPDNGKAPTSLAQRLIDVMADVGYIQKQGETQSGPKFKYVKHDDVVAQVRPALVKHGVAFLSSVRPESVSCVEVGATKSGTQRYKTTLVLDMTFINVDDPGDAYSASFPGEGIDTDDKGSGKALSYALKNGLLKVFMIEAGDEADVEQAPPPAVERPPVLGAESWAKLVENVEALGFSARDIFDAASDHGYQGEGPAMDRDMAKTVYRVLRARASEAHPPEAVAAAREKPNGGISEEQKRQLLMIIAGKNRDAGGILAKLGAKGVGDGEHWESLPHVEFDRIAEALDKMSVIVAAPDPDPEPPTDDEPKSAPLDLSDEGESPPVAAPVAAGQPAAPEGQREAASAAPAPSVEFDRIAEALEKMSVLAAEPEPEPPSDDDENDPFLAATKDNLPGKRAEGEEKPKRKATIADGQLKTLAILCADLEAHGVGEDQWRTFLHTEESVWSRRDLNKTAAVRVIASFGRWATDVQTGVKGPKEAA